MRWRPLLSASLALTLALAPAGAQPRPPAPPRAPPAVDSAINLGLVFSEVASRTLPAVVTLYVEFTRRSDVMLYNAPGFWGAPPEEPQRRHGSGSGVLIREDGVIVTNHHVVEGATRIRVHLRDGRTFAGRVLGTDPSADLAVVKIEARALPTAGFADSDAARVGEWVLAIGAPFGLEATVTHGVISAKGRAGLGQTSIEDYLQTDASINPGNSGGPLINLRGEVLGINTMILGRGTGVGFAVPSRLARLVTEQLATGGSVSRGWIGLGLQDLTADLARNFDLPPGGGAIVSQLDPRGPSARAGLALGDVITSIDGRPVTSSNDVVQSVTGHRPNDAITLAVLRNGQAHAVRVVAGPRPEAGNERAARGRGTDAPRVEGSRNLGIEVAPIPIQRARQLGVDRGVMVTVVEPGGAAERAGLRPGDVILQADQQPVGNSGDLVTATQDGHSALLVRRANGQTFIPLSLD